VNENGIVDESTRRVLRRIRSYVEQETPTGDVARCTALARHIGRDLEQLGARITRHDAPGRGLHVVAELGDGTAAPLLVMGHLDTVHPVGTLEKQPFAITSDRVQGPGVFDMKSGVALMIEAIAELQRQRKWARRPRVR
jgi:glutamate carboxypeptidase